MANKSKSARKRVRTSKEKRDRNLAAKHAIKKAIKAAEKALVAQSADHKDLVKKAVSLLDKAAKRNIIHRNKASRKKSRLQKKTSK